MLVSGMLGAPVINARTGERLGRVRRVLLDLQSRRIIGVRLRRGGVIDRRWRVAAFEDISSFAGNGVLLPDDVALREDEVSDRCVMIGGRPPRVLQEDGPAIGRLVDAVADLPDGNVAVLLVKPEGGREDLAVPAACAHCRPDGVIVVAEQRTSPPRAPDAPAQTLPEACVSKE